MIELLIFVIVMSVLLALVLHRAALWDIWAYQMPPSFEYDNEMMTAGGMNTASGLPAYMPAGPPKPEIIHGK